MWEEPVGPGKPGRKNDSQSKGEESKQMCYDRVRGKDGCDVHHHCYYSIKLMPIAENFRPKIDASWEKFFYLSLRLR